MSLRIAAPAVPVVSYLLFRHLDSKGGEKDSGEVKDQLLAPPKHRVFWSLAFGAAWFASPVAASVLAATVIGVSSLRAQRQPEAAAPEAPAKT